MVWPQIPFLECWNGHNPTEAKAEIQFLAETPSIWEMQEAKLMFFHVSQTLEAFFFFFFFLKLPKGQQNNRGFCQPTLTSLHTITEEKKIIF